MIESTFIFGSGFRSMYRGLYILSCPTINHTCIDLFTIKEI